jgi:branched-chain amino acid transport system substrate-binding protein
MFRKIRHAAAAATAIAALSAQSTAQETVRIGEYASLTGKEAAFGQSSHKGTLLAVEEINAKGGVLGRQIELLTDDNQSKQGESATIVKKLISREKVAAVLGEVASMRSMEAAPICQAYRVPMVSPSSTYPKVTEVGNYIFRVCFTDRFQGHVLAKVAKDTLKIRRIALLTSVSSAYSVGLAEYFRERFIADGGVVAIEQKYTEGSKDFDAQLTAIKAAGVEGIFVPGYYTEAALICRQARELGITVPLFGGDGWEAPELVDIGGSAVEGCYYTTHYSPQVDSAVVKEFVARFQARFKGETPDAMAALGYDSALVLADAMRRAGSTDGPAVRAALAATRDLDGVTGRTTIDAERNASKAAFVIMVKDGQFRFVQSIPPEAIAP